MTQVKENGTGGRLLKTFTYATANGTNDWKKGKLVTSSRYNYPVLGSTTYTAQVNQSYTYGGRQGRVSARQTSLTLNGTTSEDFDQTWTWNDLGDLASQTYPQCNFSPCTTPTPRTVTYGYTHAFLTSVPGYAAAISYHPNGTVYQVTHVNDPASPSVQVVDTVTKDPYSIARPNKIDAKLGTTVVWNSGVYSYDGAGNLAKAGNAYYLYDSVSRVKSGLLYTGAGAGGSTVTFSHTFDGFGNLTAATTGTTRTIPVTSSTNRLSSPSTYDTAGNLTAWNGDTYQYDHFDQAIRVASGSEIWLHMYDADDERIWSYKEGANPRIDRWTLRDLDGRVLRTYDVTNYTSWVVGRDYVYRGRQLLAAHTSDASPKDRIQFHLDHLGTPRAITNKTGTRIAYHLYYPFGEEATAVAQDAERMKLTGHERDLGVTTSAADDLDYMHARYYNAQIGRFSSLDPGRDFTPTAPQSWNCYAYARNNPVANVDRDGRIVDTVLDVGFIAYDLFDIGRSLVKGEKVSGIQYAALGADVGAALIPFATGAGAVVRAGAHADDVVHAVQAARRIGEAGEAAVRASFDIGKKEGFRIAETGKLRIPDGVNRTLGTLSEVKNVKSLSLTSQIRDFISISKANDLKFVLYVREDTKLSKPLLEARERGDVIIKFIPE